MKILNIKRISYTQMINSGIHVGTKFRELDPFNFDFIYAKRFGRSIIDLRNTLMSLKRSNYVLINVIANRGKFLFIDNMIDSAYQKHLNLLVFLGQFFFNSKIPGGIFTNFRYIYFDVVSKFFLFNKNPLTEDHRNFLKTHFSYSRMRRLPEFVFVACNTRSTSSFDETSHLRIPSNTIIDGSSRHVSLLFPMFGSNSTSASLIFFVELLSSVILAGYLNEIRQFFLISRRGKASSRRFNLLRWLKANKN